MRHTPQPPFDITEIFPFLSGMEKTTIRLHPRLEEELNDLSEEIQSAELPKLALNESKLGGTFLWPQDESWPICNKHREFYVGILQLRAEDFSEIEFPPNTNLFQLLWCPIDNDFEFPECLVFWRNVSEIANPLSDNPEPRQPNRDLVPNPCCLFPERVTEYPDLIELEGERQERVSQWDEDNDSIYQRLLSTAPSVKIGGYPPWIQDPEIPICRCGREMKHLLTIASDEFDPGTAPRWCPIEDQPIWQECERMIEQLKENPLLYQDTEVRTQLYEQGRIAAQAQGAPGLTIGGSVYVFICRHCPQWPIESVFQCS